MILQWKTPKLVGFSPQALGSTDCDRRSCRQGHRHGVHGVVPVEAEILKKKKKKKKKKTRKDVPALT